MRKFFFSLLLALCSGILLSCGTGGTKSKGTTESSQPKGKSSAGIVQTDITPPIGYKVHKTPGVDIWDPLEVKANSHEDCIPIRKAFPEGSYEIIYSLVDSGGGEMMEETAISLLYELTNK